MMKKSYFLYTLFFIVSTILNGLASIFIPPLRAMCDCLFNTIQDAMLMFVSPVAALVVVYLTHLKVKKGRPYTRSFVVSALQVIGVIILLNISNVLFISGMFF